MCIRDRDHENGSYQIYDPTEQSGDDYDRVISVPYTHLDVYKRQEQDIADALQNTILSCYENIQRLREPKYFKTWLMRILINECKDILRQKNHAAELDDFAEGVH